MERKIKRDLYISVPLMFLIGAVFHFVFEWFGSVFFIAPFFPVNESIWEHTKLAVFPLLLFYSIYYKLFKNKNLIDRDSWFSALLIAILTSVLTMIITYYTYVGIFGKDNTFVNICILLFSLFVGQIMAKRYYDLKKRIPFKCVIYTLTIVFILYTVLTFYPCKIPLFYDFNANKYSY